MSASDRLLVFPCKFPIKMMGRADAGFNDIAIGLIERHAGPVTADCVQTAQSRNGNFLSVTVTINARSQQQLDNIYHDLSNREDILFAL